MTFVTTKGFIILIVFAAIVIGVLFLLIRTEYKRKKDLEDLMNNRPKKRRKRRE